MSMERKKVEKKQINEVMEKVIFYRQNRGLKSSEAAIIPLMFPLFNLFFLVLPFVDRMSAIKSETDSVAPYSDQMNGQSRRALRRSQWRRMILSLGCVWLASGDKYGNACDWTKILAPLSTRNRLD
jgi:hypothetical protein